MEIKDIYDEIRGDCDSWADPFLETREIRNEKQSSFSYYRFYRYDQLQFRKNEQLPDILDGLKKVDSIVLSKAMYDKFDHSL